MKCRVLIFVVTVSFVLLFGSCSDIEPSGLAVVMLPGKISLEMVYCPPGAFMMGSKSDEQDVWFHEAPRHEVTLTEGFYLGKYEVTKKQWKAVMGTEPWAGRKHVLPQPDSPAIRVSWNDAQEFIRRINSLKKGRFRLPTEAEWEYACRAGTAGRFYWGDDPDYSLIDRYAWYKANSLDLREGFGHIVGAKLPNSWGLYDMSGNVWELCQDRHGDYSPGRVTDPEGPAEGTERVVRGGSYEFRSRFCRSAVRINCRTDYLGDDIGFRLVKEVNSGK